MKWFKMRTGGAESGDGIKIADGKFKVLSNKGRWMRDMSNN